MRRVASALAAVALALPIPALAQSATGEEIVVEGSLAKLSDWRVAETDHVLVYSDGREQELVRIAHNLERLNMLLSILLNRYGQTDSALKLRVTLIGDTAEFDAMDLRNLRSRQGPFAQAFPIQRYYDPREDGAVMAGSRIDQRIVLQSGQSLASLSVPGINPQTGQLDSGLFGSPNPDMLGATVNAVTVPLSAEGRIYAGFAQHYLMTYFPQPWPRWYLDGFGEIFATIRVREDGKIEYGRPPEGIRKVTDWFLNYPVRDVLNGKYLVETRRPRWTPYHAWVLAHYLFFSEERKGQLHDYLAAYVRGEPLDEAAKVFGDPAKLARDVARYDNSRVPWEQMTYPAQLAGEPVVRQLNRGEAAFLKGRLELGSRVEPASARDPDAAIAARNRWLARLRSDSARYPRHPDAQLLLAEAECRSGNAAECLAAAERVLAVDPKRVAALQWKGVALTRQALDGPADTRAARLKAARSWIARANRLDPEAPGPLLAWYRSFVDAGETPPDRALEGLLKAIDLVPAAPTQRLMLGEAFARQNNPDAARRLLRPIAEAGYDSPEKTRAAAILAGLPAR